MALRGKVWLVPLRESSTHLRKAIFQFGPPEDVLTVRELALNIVAGNLKIKLTKTQRDYIEQLADRTVSLQRKRFLVKPQGLNLVKTHLLSPFKI